MRIGEYEVEIKARKAYPIPSKDFNEDDTNRFLNLICILAQETDDKYNGKDGFTARKIADDIYTALKGNGYYGRRKES